MFAGGGGGDPQHNDRILATTPDIVIEPPELIVTVSAITTTLQTAIGSDALPISQLLPIIASYAATFVAQIKSYRPCEEGTTTVLKSPYGLGPTYESIATGCTEEIIIADTNNQMYRKFSAATGVMTPFIGSGLEGCADGTAFEARFKWPVSICVDPCRPHSYYISDVCTIRHFDEKSGVVSRVAGAERGFADGIGAAASLNDPIHIGITSDGSTIYASDCDNNRIRRVDIRSQKVSTVHRGAKFDPFGSVGTNQMRSPKQFVWDIRPGVKHESVLIISANRSIWRLDVATGTKHPLHRLRRSLFLFSRRS